MKFLLVVSLASFLLAQPSRAEQPDGYSALGLWAKIKALPYSHTYTFQVDSISGVSDGWHDQTKYYFEVYFDLRYTGNQTARLQSTVIDEKTDWNWLSPHLDSHGYYWTKSLGYLGDFAVGPNKTLDSDQLGQQALPSLVVEKLDLEHAVQLISENYHLEPADLAGSFLVRFRYDDRYHIRIWSSNDPLDQFFTPSDEVSTTLNFDGAMNSYYPQLHSRAAVTITRAE